MEITSIGLTPPQYAYCGEYLPLSGSNDDRCLAVTFPAYFRKQSHTVTSMSVEILLRYFHFVSIFAIVGVLVSEYLLLKKTLTRAEIGRLARVDAVYGLAAIILLSAGLTLWLGGFGKPAVYYTQNWVFHLKLTLFLAIGLLSIYPTVFFLRNRKGDQKELVAIPPSIFWMLRFELLFLAMIPLLAGLMARGIGSFG